MTHGTDKIIYTCSLCGKQIQRRARGKAPNRCRKCNALWSSCRGVARHQCRRQEVTDKEIMDAVNKRLEWRQARFEADWTEKSEYQGFMAPREVVRQTFTSADLQNEPAEKAARMINQVLKRERNLVL